MFDIVEKFEKTVAEFYGAPYAVAVDCCTHAVELCLRHTQSNSVTCPAHTYISIPFTFEKLNLTWKFTDQKWIDFYYLGNTNIIDAAVYWKQNGYIDNTFMCLSFQFRKHLSTGRGGMILCSNYRDFIALKKMSYDGRLPSVPWSEQNISSIGYHYYMTPETANIGLHNFNQAVAKIPAQWSWKNYPNLTQMEVFNEH